MEFLAIVTEVRELGNPAATRRSWRAHGPDANGSYGGLQVAQMFVGDEKAVQAVSDRFFFETLAPRIAEVHF